MENLVGKPPTVTTGRLISAIYTVCLNPDARVSIVISAAYKTNTERICSPLPWFQKHEFRSFCTQRNAGIQHRVRLIKVELTLLAKECVPNSESATAEER